MMADRSWKNLKKEKADVRKDGTVSMSPLHKTAGCLQF